MRGAEGGSEATVVPGGLAGPSRRWATKSKVAFREQCVEAQTFAWPLQRTKDTRSPWP
jgi:hypothetical protein